GRGATDGAVDGALEVDGAGDGAIEDEDEAAGDTLGCGGAGTQNVPSLVHHPDRPSRSTPATSASFGGGVRDAAGDGDALSLGVGVALGAALRVDCVFVVTDRGDGATQSSGCTTTAPVAGSCSMTRTPDAFAHCSSPIASTPLSVTR